MILIFWLACTWKNVWQKGKLLGLFWDYVIFFLYRHEQPAPKIAFLGKIQPTKQKSHQPWSKLKSLEVILILLSRIKETAPQVEHPLNLLSILYRAERPDLLLNPAEGVCFTPHNPSLSFLYCDRCEIGFKTLVKSNVFSRKGPRNT